MKGVFIFVFAFSFFSLCAQYHESIHQIQMEYYAANPYPDTIAAQNQKSSNNAGCVLNKRVFGWHPYWVGSGVANNYQWNLLSDLCYFNYEFNASTGAITTTNGFLTSPVIDSALSNGTKVHLCVTMFDTTAHNTFFANLTAQKNLITNLINAIQARNAKGINLDFEGVKSKHKTALTNFVIRLSDSLHTRVPGSELSIALPAVDWGNTWNVSALNSYVDLFIFMGYDYYYGGSTIAGPTDPLYNFQTSFNYTLSKTITYYLHAGVSPSKLLMGVPYYGFEWQTAALTVPSSTSATGVSRTFKAIKTNSSGNYSVANRGWDGNSLSSYWAYTSSGKNYQAWVSDAEAMNHRFNLVNIRDIGGIGIWALAYDDGYSDFWDLIADKFSSCAVIPCSDTIWDLGGPTRPYYPNEDFVYTIQPSNAVGVSLNFTQFNLESGYDSLWIFDGADINSPLIGGYSGTASPGTVSSSGNALTIKFHSDGATQNAGYTAVWNCITDNIPPATIVDAPTGWQTADFNVSFTDSDNNAVEHSFWHVLQFDGVKWNGNYKFGFLNENFNNGMPSDWTSYLGNWDVFNDCLIQSDSSLGNTNLAVDVLQDSSSIWLHHWKMKFGPADATNNRRIGAHYFCSDVTQSNRENSYMTYFRLDNQKVQLYKCVNNIYYLKTDVSFPFLIDTWYDVKILYNPETGYNAAWIDDVLVSSWTDTAPLKSGSGFSLRVGNCKAWYDDIEIYRSRPATELVTVGSDSSKMIQYQNPNPATPSCRIKSIILDKANLFSLIQSSDINIDYTKPIAPLWVADMYFPSQTDYDTVYYSGILHNNTACGNSHDDNSGIEKYYFNMGAYCGDNSLYQYVASTDTTADIGIFSVTGNYYTYVYSVNGAGLHSDTVCSDGIYVEQLTNLNDNSDKIKLFPNPAEDYINIFYVFRKNCEVRIFSCDGRLALKSESGIANNIHLDLLSLTPGLYYLEIIDDEILHSAFIKK